MNAETQLSFFDPPADDSSVAPVATDAKWKPRKMRPWHQMVAEFILLHPTASNSDIAEHFDMHKQTITLLVSSDMFKSYFATRKQEIEARVNETAFERLNGKLARLAEQTVDVLAEKIEAQREVLGLKETRETMDVALQHLGFGLKKTAPAGNATTNVQNMFVVSAADLSEARALMQRQGVIEADPQPQQLLRAAGE